MKNIKEAEELTGISRQNIRYYEKMGLLNPKRDAGNGYRKYDEEDIGRLKAILLFRKLDMPLEEIHKLLDHEIDLQQALDTQKAYLQKEQQKLEAALAFCDTIQRPPEEAGRWIKVSWGGKTRESYRTNLQVVSKDRPNLLVDISTILSAAKVHVSSLNARSTADGFALISLAVDVSDSQQLQAVMRRLEQISGVMRVTRPAG